MSAGICISILVTHKYKDVSSYNLGSMLSHISYKENKRGLIGENEDYYLCLYIDYFSNIIFAPSFVFKNMSHRFQCITLSNQTHAFILCVHVPVVSWSAQFLESPFVP